MNFLAPIFLLGALAVALPVLFHLVRRTTRERTPFSSLMFLSPTPPRLTSRNRLEHLLLLLLRCLALCLLAVGFARPFVNKAVSNNPTGAAAKRIVVLVDTSASMRRAGLWQQARERAESVLRKTSPVDEAALFTFDRQLNPVVSFEQWNGLPRDERIALAARKLAELSPGWSGTYLGNALIQAAEALADNRATPAGGARQIVLISDLQEGSRLETLQGYEWPRGLELSVEALKPKPASNASLQLAADSDEASPNTAGSARVRVSNAPDSKREQFQAGWAQASAHAFAGEPVGVYVPPGQSRIVTLPPAPNGTGMDSIMLQGDDEDFDNTVFVVSPETARLTVLYLGSEAAGDPKQPLYFLERAFQETRRQMVQVLARPPGAPILDPEARTAMLFLVSDPLPAESARALHEQVTEGKTALVTLKSDGMAPTLARLVGLDHLNLEEARPNNYAMLAEIDFRHPLFAPFADPRFSDFTKIHFWKYRRLEANALPGARVVARFDSGDPALVEVPVGKGRLLVLTSGWQPSDSQLALSTKFVPLLYSLLDVAGAPSLRPMQYQVGDVVPLEVPADGESEPIIRLPDGSQVSVAAGETNFSQTAQRGIYTLVRGQSSKRFAVNLDPAESRTAPMSVEELERLGAPVKSQAPTAAYEAERKVRLQNADLESRQKLWRWFIVATLAVVLLEIWLAGRTGRRTELAGS